MYTELKPYQQIIALLKKYNIRNCVLSAGSRNVPFVHSVEKKTVTQQALPVPKERFFA